MRDRYFSDEELVAYLDGETEFAPIEAIEAARASDAALRARLEALSIDHATLTDAFAGLVPDQTVLPMPAATAQRRGPWLAVTAALVAGALALGVAIGSARNVPLNGWTEYVAAYQALYSSSTLAHVERDAAQQQRELDRVAAAIGKSIAVQDLTLFPDVDYTRAQILSFEGRPLIQLAFLTSTGEPVALCIIRSAERHQPEDMQTTVMEGQRSALWSQNGYEYILIGGRDEALIHRMSSVFRSTRI